MKIYLTISLFLISLSTISAQVKVDISNYLKEKKTKISEHHILILSDGTLQIVTNENFYKFDRNGQSLGPNETNTSSPINYGSTFNEYYYGFTSDFGLDRMVKFDGDGHLDIVEMFSNRPNVFHKINVPKFDKPTNIKSLVNTDVTWIDENNLLVAQSAIAYLPLLGKQTKEKNLYNTFIRMMKVNIQSNSYEEKYFFIDKGNLNSENYKGLFWSMDFDNEKNLVVDFIFGKSPIEKNNTIYDGGTDVIDVTAERWKINFHDDTEIKIGEIGINEKCSENGLLKFTSSKNGFIIFSTTKTNDGNGFALKMNVYDFENGEYKLQELEFPVENVSLVAKFVPYIGVLTYNGEKKYILEGDYVYNKKGKIRERKVIVLSENSDCLVYDISKEDSYRNYYSKNDNIFIYHNELLTQDIRERLNAPMLKPNKMLNYVYAGNYFVSRKINDSFLIVHADWRVGPSGPEFIIEISDL